MLAINIIQGFFFHFHFLHLLDSVYYKQYDHSHLIIGCSWLFGYNEAHDSYKKNSYKKKSERGAEGL